MAQSEWQDSAVAEGLMLDSEGQVIEGTMSNLFMFDQGRLLTPNLGRCGTLGVMRGLVLDIASNLDIPVAIEDIALEEIWEADALFLCNSLIGIWPIHTLGEREYGVEAIPPALIEAVMAQGFRP